MIRPDQQLGYPSIWFTYYHIGKFLIEFVINIVKSMELLNIFKFSLKKKRQFSRGSDQFNIVLVQDRR